MLPIENVDGKEDHRHTIGDDEEYDSEEDAYEEADVPSNYLPSQKFEEKTYTVLRGRYKPTPRGRSGKGFQCSTLSISKDKAVIILLHFKRNAEWVTDGWTVKEENIRRDLV